MYFTARERHIINILTGTGQEWTIQHLADLLDVSPRTVHRDLGGIERAISPMGITLNRKTGRGISLTGPDKAVQALRIAAAKERSTEFTAQERQVFILVRLLLSSEPLKLQVIANELGVTGATISHDLDRAEGFLQEFGLTLIRRRGYGLAVVGEERQIREAFIHLFTDQMDEIDILSFIRDQSSEDSRFNKVFNQLPEFIDKTTWCKIENVVRRMRPHFPYELTDNAFISLILHLTLAVERLKKGERIHIDPVYLDDLKKTPAYTMAVSLCEKLQDKLEIQIPEEEAGFMTMHLMGAKVRSIDDLMLEDKSFEVIVKARNLLKDLSEALDMDLLAKEQLFNDLVLHLKPALYRLEHGLSIYNPLTQQIKIEQPELFEVTEKIAKRIFDGDLPDEEIAFIVLHIASAFYRVRQLKVAAVCSSGIGTAKILASKLKEHFPEIGEVSHFSLFELDRLETGSYDLLVSTVPLHEKDNYLLVSPLLPEEDLIRLRKEINLIKMNSDETGSVELKQEEKGPELSLEATQKYVAAVNQLLHALFVIPTNKTKKEAILFAVCREAEEKGFLTDANAVTEALLKREESGGLGIPGTKTALYHTRTDDIAAPAFFIVTLNEPLTVPGMDDSLMEAQALIVMLAPKQLSQQTLEALSRLSVLVMEDERCAKALQSREPDAILQYFSGELSRFLRNKLS